MCCSVEARSLLVIFLDWVNSGTPWWSHSLIGVDLISLINWIEWIRVSKSSKSNLIRKEGYCLLHLSLPTYLYYLFLSSLTLYTSFYPFSTYFS